MRQLAIRWLNLIHLRCSARRLWVMTTSPPKKAHLAKPLKASLLLVADWMVEFVFPAVGSQFPQDGRWCNLSGFNGQGHTNHVRQMRLDQAPLDRFREKTVQVCVMHVGIGAEEFE